MTDNSMPITELCDEARGLVPTVDECLSMADTYCQRESWHIDFWRPHVSVLASEVRRLKSAIEETLSENAHMADGDNCTLLRLKQAMPRDTQRGGFESRDSTPGVYTGGQHTGDALCVSRHNNQAQRRRE